MTARRSWTRRASAQKEGPATRLVYDGNKWVIKVGDQTVATGTFKIDSTRKPKEIDIMDESGVKNDKTKLGIFELDGDVYKLPRPGRETSTAGVYQQSGQRSLPGRKQARKAIEASPGGPATAQPDRLTPPPT